MKQDIVDRFFSHVEIGEPDDCCNWQGYIRSDGYGQFYDGETTVRANRLSYEFFNGNISGDLIVRHNCHNPRCVNPSHLELGDKQDNSDDMTSSGRQSWGEDRWNVKVSIEDVEIIRHLCANKHRFSVTQRAVADMFSISESEVSKIVNRKQWYQI